MLLLFLVRSEDVERNLGRIWRLMPSLKNVWESCMLGDRRLEVIWICDVMFGWYG